MKNVKNLLILFFSPIYLFFFHLLLFQFFFSPDTFFFSYFFILTHFDRNQYFFSFNFIFSTFVSFSSSLSILISLLPYFFLPFDLLFAIGARRAPINSPPFYFSTSPLSIIFFSSSFFFSS